jgi:hypothetical protein
MIQIEYLNDGSLVKHYSDAGYLLLQNETGNKYSEPLDIVPCQYTYTETDELIEDDVIDGDEEISSDEFMTMIEEVL